MGRSEAGGGSRSRRYRAEDVWRLKERKERRRDPDGVVEGALHWGTPVMESGITLIADGKLYYRGRDVAALAVGSAIEEVAALIWIGDPASSGDLFPREWAGLSPRLRTALGTLEGLSTVEIFQVLLPVAEAGDPAAYDLRPPAVARTGAHIIRLMTSVATGEAELAGGLDETLARGWCPQDPAAEALLNSALSLCADHELPVSTFAARCVASSEATPYGVVAAGLAAPGGIKHGGQVGLVEAFLREGRAAGEARSDERRGGEGGRSRWSPYHLKKK